MIVLFIVTLLFILLFLLYRISNIDKGRITVEKFIYLYFLLLYVVIPILYISYFDKIQNESTDFWVTATKLDYDNLVCAYYILLIGLSGITIGLIAGKSIRVRVPKITIDKINLYENLLVGICLLSSMVTYYHIYKVGGISEAILSAYIHRMHGADLPVGQLSKLQPMVVFGSILLLPFKKKINIVFICTAIIYLLLSYSRAYVAMFLIGFYFYWINQNKQFSLNKLMIVSLLTLPLAFIGNSAKAYFAGNDFIVNLNVFSTIVSQLSATISNVINAKEFVHQYGFGFYSDIKSFFPEAVFGLDKAFRSWQSLTEFYLGGFHSTGIQIDLLTYGYTQLSFLGVFINSLCYGIFFGYLSNYINKLIQTTAYENIFLPLEIIILFFAGSMLVWGSFDITVVIGNSKYWIFIILFFLAAKLRFGITKSPLKSGCVR